jgi:hypothetical protein
MPEFGGQFMSDMLEVVIDSIRVSLMSQQRIVILRELNAERYLPIWIGIYEAESITIALQEVEVARPLTHDLVKNIFTSLNASILRAEVVALRDDTFYGNIVAEVDGRTLNIDSPLGRAGISRPCASPNPGSPLCYGHRRYYPRRGYAARSRRIDHRGT